jgi:hypothetical protein
LRLSTANQNKAEKNRRAAEKIKLKEKGEEKEEELMKKKREADQKYNEKLKSLPPDQQRKMEDKKRQ